MKILNISFESVKLNELTQQREKYFSSLPSSQEYYLEATIKNAECISILYDNNIAGYALLDRYRILLEFFVSKNYMQQAESIFDLLVEMKEIKYILCKSFDHNLLELSLQKKYPSTIIGILYRDTLSEKLNYSEDLITRTIEDSDIDAIMEINENVFTGKDNLQSYVQNKSAIIFEKFDELIGVGIYTKILKNKPETDIGVLVNRQFRNRGYGTQIIRYIHNLCIENNLKPQCGCAFSNVSSRRAIEKAGYIPNFRLIEFSVESN